MSFSLLRKRIPSEPSISPAYATLTHPLPGSSAPTTVRKSGALARIMSGIFGARPDVRATASANVQSVPAKRGFYAYHEGDLFSPGTGNYVFDYPLEYPLQTVWGVGFLRRPNTFNPLQPAQLGANQVLVINGIGGLVAGQFATQPLDTQGQ